LVVPVIEVTNLRKVYGDRAVVDGMSFSVEPGEIFGILWRTTVGGLTPPASPSANGHPRRDLRAGWCCTFVARGA
jgi:ABC-type phosphonate transport system ATPase subunit